MANLEKQKQKAMQLGNLTLITLNSLKRFFKLLKTSNHLLFLVYLKELAVISADSKPL
jgi:hypothetical protein